MKLATYRSKNVGAVVGGSTELINRIFIFQVKICLHVVELRKPLTSLQLIVKISPTT